MPDNIKPYISLMGEPFDWNDIGNGGGGIAPDQITIDAPVEFNGNQTTGTGQELESVTVIADETTTTPIQNTIDRTTPASTKPYEIKVPPGSYMENLAMPGYTSLVGAGLNTSIQPTTTNGISIDTSANGETIEFRNMEFVAGGAVLMNITAVGATILFKHCRIKANGSADSVVLTKTANLGNAIKFLGCEFVPNGSYTMDILDSASPASVTDKIYLIGCFFGLNCEIGIESGGIVIMKAGCYTDETAFINDVNVHRLDGYHASAFGLVNAQLWGDVYGYLPYPRVRPEVSIFSNITGTFSLPFELRNPAQLILAQTFPVLDLSLPSLRRAAVKLKRTGTLSGDIWLEKRAVITATKLPTGSALVTSNKIAAQDIASGVPANYTFEFPINAYSVTTNEDVAICLNGDYTGDASNYIGMYYKAGAITGYVMSYYDGAAWQESSSSGSFYVALYGGDAGSSVSLDNLVAGNGRLKEANLPQGTSGYPLLGTGALKPAYGTDLATGVTIGSAYIYRAGGTDVPATDGGTGQSGYAIGDMLYAITATQLAKLPLNSYGMGAVMTISGGVPVWTSPNITTVRKFFMSVSDPPGGMGYTRAPIWDTILNTDVSGLGTMATQAASSVAITGGTIVGLTGLAIRDTSAAYDVTIAGVSSVTLTAGRTLTIDVANAARTLKLTGNTALNQELLTTSSPTFGNITDSGLTASCPVYTDANKRLTPTPPVMFKCSANSHDVSATGAGATQTLTGVGFTPAHIRIFVTTPGGTSYSVGQWDNTPGQNNMYYDTSMHYDTNLFRYTSGAGDAYGNIASVNSDGFVITWGKVSSPTGTAYFTYQCYR